MSNLIKELCGGKKPYVNPNHLETKHFEIKKRAMNCFYETKKFGGEGIYFYLI